jgi:N-acetylglucosaminyldiphosphoundecaprenol N-acetyl-beta-D-mannosaminyltransferase
MEKQIRILGVDVDPVDFDSTLDQVAVWIADHRAAVAGVIHNSQFIPPSSRPSPLICRQICTVNPEFIVDAHRDPAFAAVLRRADLRVPDGIGVLWAARMAGRPLKERVTGSDGIYRIAERASQCRWRVFLLGAAPGVAATTAEILRCRYPGLEVVGAYSGSPADADWPAIHGWLASTQPDILLVAFGHPKQDDWIDHHRAELPAAVAIGVGGAFDFVAGVARRAPAWMQRMGLEWLHRLLREPWRWRRMMKLPVFAVLVLVQNWRKNQ